MNYNIHLILVIRLITLLSFYLYIWYTLTPPPDPPIGTQVLFHRTHIMKNSIEAPEENRQGLLPGWH